jgi:hypothetical protein
MSANLHTPESVRGLVLRFCPNDPGDVKFFCPDDQIAVLSLAEARVLAEAHEIKRRAYIERHGEAPCPGDSHYFIPLDNVIRVFGPTEFTEAIKNPPNDEDDEIVEIAPGVLGGTAKTEAEMRSKVKSFLRRRGYAPVAQTHDDEEDNSDNNGE